MIELKDPYNKLWNATNWISIIRYYPRLQLLPAISVCKHPITKEITCRAPNLHIKKSLCVVSRHLTAGATTSRSDFSYIIENLFVTNFIKVNLQVCWHWFSYLSWLLRLIRSFRGRCIGFLIRHQIISGTRWFRMKPIGFVMATYLHSRPSRCQYTQHFEPFENNLALKCHLIRISAVIRKVD
jgi:hypothetical protein